MPRASQIEGGRWAQNNFRLHYVMKRLPGTQFFWARSPLSPVLQAVAALVTVRRCEKERSAERLEDHVSLPMQTRKDGAGAWVRKSVERRLLVRY